MIRELISDIITKEQLEKTGKIDLSEQNLTEWPKELNEMIWLEEIDLNSNLIGSIHNIKHLNKLISLNLYRNKILTLTGAHLPNSLQKLELGHNNLISIPKKLGPNLVELSIHNNNLKEISNLEPLISLKRLMLNQNKITKIQGLGFNNRINRLYLNDNLIEEIEGINHLNSLEVLRLQNNKIKDIEWFEIEKFPKLKELYLYNNPFTISKLNALSVNVNNLAAVRKHIETSKHKRIIALEKSKKTGMLNLGNCGLTSWPTEVFEMTWLKVLIMNDDVEWNETSAKFVWNFIEGKSLNPNALMEIPKEIAKLSELEAFSIGGVFDKPYGIFGFDAAEFPNRIKVLDLSFCMLEGIENLSKLTALESLELDHNNLSQIDLTGLTSLKNLNISHNLISSLIDIHGPMQLISLNLSNNFLNTIIGWEKGASIINLDLSNNKIFGHLDCSYLPNNTKLEHLNFAFNEITSISGLEKFRNLKQLILNSNKLNSFTGALLLPKLDNLDLLGNQFNIFPKLNHLSNLKTINFGENQLVRFEDLQDFKALLDHELLFLVNFKGNPFTEEKWISQEWLQSYGDDKQQIAARLYEFLNESENFSSEYTPPTKIIVLGNSGVGKSTVSISLMLDKIPYNNQREQSTHGLKIRWWENQNALIYDFGGQDYYHAVYNVFFTDNTLYLILWNESSNRNFVIEEAGEQAYFNFDNKYWFGNLIYYLKNKKTVEMIGLFNSFATSTLPLYDHKILSAYSINKFFVVSFPPDQNQQNEVPELQRKIFIAGLKQSLSSLGNQSYHKLEVELMKNVASKLDDYKTRTIPFSREDFYKEFIVDKVALTESSLNEDILLSVLHHRGLIFRLRHSNPTMEKIWVNPEGLNYAIHQNISKQMLIETNGIIPLESIGKYFDQDILSVMLESNLIFKHTYKVEETNIEEYIIPQYLPIKNIGSSLYRFATVGLIHGFTLKFQDYIPQGFMSKLITRFGTEPHRKHFSRYEMIFALAEDVILVKISLNLIELTISVDVKMERSVERQREQIYHYLFVSIIGAYQNATILHLNYYAFVNEILPIKSELSNTKTSEIHTKPASSTINILTVKYKLIEFVPEGLMLSLDGKKYVNYKDLVKTEENYVSAKCFNESDGSISQSATIQRYLFNAFVNEKASVPKKLFISYSSKNSDFMKAFKTHLIPYERENKLSVWVDRMIDTGMEWDEQIQDKLEKADVIVYLLSPDFLATPYIMDIEVKKGLEYYNLNKGGARLEVYFIILQDCSWQLYFGEYQQHLLQDMVTKKLMIIEDPGNHVRWMKVMKDLSKKL
ncbi:MAG TPA: leucine-rich repeat domain-containing protein [Saprospiraceae bacterium]|nr:leucine-rich repeat domain-containing protein [Saprospiraceae bacterium]